LSAFTEEKETSQTVVFLGWASGREGKMLGKEKVVGHAGQVVVRTEHRVVR